jgi:hypothetical protein
MVSSDECDDDVCWGSDEAFTPATIMNPMGFNPYRKFIARRTDYLFVAAAVIASAALVAWAFFG